jgi:hypothetical protein
LAVLAAYPMSATSLGDGTYVLQTHCPPECHMYGGIK